MVGVGVEGGGQFVQADRVEGFAERVDRDAGGPSAEPGVASSLACGDWTRFAVSRVVYRKVTMVSGPLWMMSAYSVSGSWWACPAHQAGHGIVTSPRSMVARVTVRGSVLTGAHPARRPGP